MPVNTLAYQSAPMATLDSCQLTAQVVPHNSFVSIEERCRCIHVCFLIVLTHVRAEAHPI